MVISQDRMSHWFTFYTLVSIFYNVINNYEGRHVDLWGCFVGRADMCNMCNMCKRDGLCLVESGKGAAVFADELPAAVDSGM